MLKIPIELRMARVQAASKIAESNASKIERASSVAFVTMAENGMIDEVTATENIDAFAPWVANASVSTGQLRTFEVEVDGLPKKKLYRCLSPHVTQDDWTPDKTPSLWVEVGDPSVEFPPWSPPVGAHDSYDKGAKVTHNNKKWLSDYDGNAWEPGVFGWTEYVE